MKLFANSLRLRLLVLILLPLLLVASLALSWQYRESTLSAEAVFDRNLTVLALAISRDVVISGGDTLSPATTALFAEASGAPFKSHVRGPDGSFVSGYSPPPIAPAGMIVKVNEPVMFESVYRDRKMRVAQLKERATIDQISGFVVVTVWQDLEQRRAFAQELAFQGALLAAILIVTVCFVVFFGVGLGLRPLLALEHAITKRSSQDLSPIRRRVPNEVKGVVMRINELFEKVTANQEQKDRFISNAAHQLRNPLASILALAEVATDAKTIADARHRSGELLTASRQAVRLSEQLLSYERLRGAALAVGSSDVNQLVAKALSHYAEMNPKRVTSGNVEFAFNPGKDIPAIQLDSILMEQAIENIIDNALRHGGAEISKISISTSYANKEAHIKIGNDGKLIPKKQQNLIFERFAQAEPNSGAGLGLAIVHEICALHDGKVTLTSRAGWTSFVLSLPHS